MGIKFFFFNNLGFFYFKTFERNKDASCVQGTSLAMLATQNFLLK